MLRAEVSGATSLVFTGKNDVGCATQHAFDAGLDAVFLGVNQGTLGLVVRDVTEGETGKDYPARVTVEKTSAERWRGEDCRASIKTHELAEVENTEIGELRRYRVAGEGGCAVPLASVPAGSDPVRLESFQFRAQFTWRD